jgi:Holliday junction resolvase
MVQRLIEHLKQKGVSQLRADLPGYEQPQKITWTQTGKGHIPDVSAYHANVMYIFEVEDSESIYLDHTADQFRLFGAFARQHKARFIVVVPQISVPVAQQVLEKVGATAAVWHI